MGFCGNQQQRHICIQVVQSVVNSPMVQKLGIRNPFGTLKMFVTVDLYIAIRVQKTPLHEASIVLDHMDASNVFHEIVEEEGLRR